MDFNKLSFFESDNFSLDYQFMDILMKKTESNYDSYSHYKYFSNEDKINNNYNKNKDLELISNNNNNNNNNEIDSSPDYFKDIYKEVEIPEELINKNYFLKVIEKDLNNLHIDEVLDFIETEYPLIIHCCPAIKCALMSLWLFLLLSKEDNDSIILNLKKLNDYLSRFDVIYLRKKDYIMCLTTVPCLFKSKFFKETKLPVYINSLKKVIKNELEMLSSATLNKNPSLIESENPIYIDYSIIRNLEDELMYFLALYLSCNSPKKLDIDSFYLSIDFKFNYTDDLHNRIFIQEFIEKSDVLKISIKYFNQLMLEHYTVEEVSNINNISINNVNTKEDCKKIDKDINFNDTKPKVFILSKIKKKEFNNCNTLKEKNLNNIKSFDSNKNTINFNKDSNNDNKGIVFNKGKCRSLKLDELKLFNFKFLKRENIDKKVIRKFRKYLKARFKFQEIEQSKFAINFCKESLFPPFSFEGKTFKSFNASYMIWIFSNNDIKEYYEEYIQLNLESLNNFLVNTLKVNNFNDKALMLNYVKNIARIYSQYQNLIIDLDKNSEDIYNNNVNKIIDNNNNNNINTFKNNIHDN